MNTLLRIAAALTLAASTATPGLAASSVTSSFTVSITINPECKIISASNISFGTVTFITGNIDMDGSIIVQCTNTTPYNIGLGAGAGTGATVTNRLMTGPGSVTLPYALYRDAGHTQNWGVTTGAGGDTQAGTGNGANQTYAVHGRVVSQVAAPGAYTDSIVVTLTY